MYYNRENKQVIKVKETRVWTLYRTVHKYMKDYGRQYHSLLIPVHLTTIQDELPPFIFTKEECKDT